MSQGLCSCHTGATGGPCKHQFVVAKEYKLESWNFLPVQSESMRKLLHSVATGTDTLPDNWFCSLRGETTRGEISHPTSVTPLLVSSSTTSAEETSSAGETAMMVVDEHVDEGLLNRLEDVFEDMKEKLRNSPGVLNEPFKKFVASYSEISGESSLASALCCFGKYSWSCCRAEWWASQTHRCAARGKKEEENDCRWTKAQPSGASVYFGQC